MLRSTRFYRPFHHSCGDGTCVQKFGRSSYRDALREIKDSDGNVIASEPFKVPVVNVLSLEDNIHPVEETADLYSLPNLQKSGVTLRPVSSNWLPLSLDYVSVVTENLMDKVDAMPSVEDASINPIVSPDNAE